VSLLPALLLTTLTAGPARAQAPEQTPFLARERSPLAHARAVSFDLRGLPLTAEETAAIQAAGELEDELLDLWLSTDAFTEQVVLHHRNLFLNNVSFGLDPYQDLRDYGRYGFGVYFRYYLSQIYGRNAQSNCTDYDADVNALNQPLSWRTNAAGGRDEGAVDVEPWWAPGTTIRVCAYDAQLTEVSSSGTDCSTAEGQLDPECGCGPNLIYCSTEAQQQAVTGSLSEALSQRVRDVVGADEPYANLLDQPTTYLNGTLAQYYRHRVVYSDTLSSPVPTEALPALSAADPEVWVEVEPGDHYAGILTEPGWLLRFQTNRGRANRFFTEFLCGEFLPPEAGIMEIAEENPTPDLSQKPVCKDCHTVLEPWAAYWGRWQEVGANYYDPDIWPTYSEYCEACGPRCPDTYCRFHYLLDPQHHHEDDYQYHFNPYVFLVGDAEQHPTLGPGQWGTEIAADGRLARCAAEKAAIWLLGRPEAELDPTLIDAWADDFTASGLSYRALVRAIVSSPTYRRAR